MDSVKPKLNVCLFVGTTGGFVIGPKVVVAHVNMAPFPMGLVRTQSQHASLIGPFVPNEGF